MRHCRSEFSVQRLSGPVLRPRFVDPHGLGERRRFGHAPDEPLRMGREGGPQDRLTLREPLPGYAGMDITFDSRNWC